MTELGAELEPEALPPGRAHVNGAGGVAAGTVDLGSVVGLRAPPLPARAWLRGDQAPPVPLSAGGVLFCGGVFWGVLFWGVLFWGVPFRGVPLPG